MKKFLLLFFLLSSVYAHGGDSLTSDQASISRSDTSFSENSTSVYMSSTGKRFGLGTASPSAYKLHVKGGNANSLIVDNDGTQFTEMDLANNGTVKTSWYWDNTASNGVITGKIGFNGQNHGFGVTPLGYIGVRMTNIFTSDGGSTFVAGLDLDPTITMAAGDIDYANYLNVAGFGITTQANEAITLISSARFAQPQITLSGTASVAKAATVYIVSPPLVGTTKASLYVEDGDTILGATTGSLAVGSTSLSSGQKVQVNGGVNLTTATAQPACNATTRGTFWIVQAGAGVKDQVEVCAKDAANVYAWRVIY